MKKKRCAIVKMTNQARVLKDLRIKNALSMQEAGYQINRSDSYISHIENGRVDIPRGEDFLRLLSVYNIDEKNFNEKVRVFKKKTPKLEILSSLLNKLDESNINTLIDLTESFLTNQVRNGRRIS